MFESRPVENVFLPLHGPQLLKAQYKASHSGRHYLILMPMTHAAEVTLFRALVAILVVWAVSVLPAGYLIVTAGRLLRSHLRLWMFYSYFFIFLLFLSWSAFLFFWI